MKKNYILASMLAASVGFLAFQKSGNQGVVNQFVQEHKFSSGGQSGLTGAPGDANCTQCHSGQAQSGSSENVFTLLNGTNPTLSYVPGTSYNATLALASNPNKKGFSAVVLNGSNANAGTFVGSGIGGTQKFSGNGRDYVSHTSASNTSSTSLWLWTWNAPAASVGNVTFYIASNVANGNGQNSGDVIHLSQHVITDATAGTDEHTIDQTDFSAGYSPSTNKVLVDFTYTGIGEMFFNLVDLSGKSVFTYALGESQIGSNKESITLPSEIENGIYAVHFFIGNKAMTAKIMVQR